MKELISTFEKTEDRDVEMLLNFIKIDGFEEFWKFINKIVISRKE